MRHTLILLALLLTQLSVAQDYAFAPGEKHPYGLPNPDAPKEVSDFKEMIGKCHCKSVARIDQNTWTDTVNMTWEFRYIMDGWAVQDITYKEDGKHSGSIRQFNADSSRWYVHYYSNGSASPTLPAWEGNRQDNKIILYREQAAPNGLPGAYKITFYDLSDHGYNWLGEWVNKEETFSYPTWKIFCVKEEQKQ